MIAAVKVESSALDSMRDKLKEIETLRTQLANFSKRILDADQANLNLKTNMLKLQEAYNELKKSKAEVRKYLLLIYLDHTYIFISIFYICIGGVQCGTTAPGVEPGERGAFQRENGPPIGPAGDQRIEGPSHATRKDQ